APRARLDRRPGLGSVSMAGGTGRGQLDLDFPRNPGRDLGQREFHLDGPVRAARGPRAGAASEDRPEVSATEEHLENVGDASEAGEVRLEAARAQALVAIAVVHRAPFAVAQDLVGLRHLLEPLLGGGVVPVHIRMELPREPAEGLLDLVVARLAADPEHLVVVAWHLQQATV